MNAPADLSLNAAFTEMLADPRRLDVAFAEGLRPDPDLTVSEWADANRMLSSESSAEHGLWRTSRVPFMREIMDAQSPSHPGNESALMKGTQIAGSETMYNVVGAAIDQYPCPVLLVMPTTDMAKLTSRQRIQPMLDETVCLRNKVKPARSRDSGNTVLLKKFRGGLLRLTGANSGPGLRSMPVRILLLDEIDAYPADVAGEGDPVAVAKKRTDTFGTRKKIFEASSPKLSGSSRIHRRYLAGTQARYEVPCPHCKHEQPLVWDNVRWVLAKRRELVCKACGGVSVLADESVAAACLHCGVAGAPDDIKLVDTEELARVWYECASCQGEIEERWKTWMLANGRHVHQVPGHGRFLGEGEEHRHAIWVRFGHTARRFLPRFQRPLSWWVSGLYSPLGWFTWQQAVKDFLEAQKGGYDEDTGESLLQVFWNTVRGEPFEVQGEQVDQNVLATRAEPYDLGKVPAGGLLLTAFVDVQGNRLEFKCKAYGRGEESWLVDYQVIHGDPTLSGPGSVWDQAIQLRDRAYQHAGGESVYIVAMGVDSGYLTQTVYDFCRQWSRKHVFATKGVAGAGKTALGGQHKVDFSHRGKPIKNGATYWPVGVDTVKERIFANMAIAQHGPGYMHFPRGLPQEYFEQITSEKKIQKRRKGAVINEYVKTRERNEALDLEVGCYVAAVYAGLKRVNWDQLERVINPTQRDIFAAPGQNRDDAAQAAADATTTDRIETPLVWRPPRKNWVNSS